MCKKENINIKKSKIEIVDTTDIKIEKAVPPNLSNNYKVVIHRKSKHKIVN